MMGVDSFQTSLCISANVLNRNVPSRPLQDDGRAASALYLRSTASPGVSASAYLLPNMSFMINDVELQAWLRQGRPKPASNVRNSEK